jgi:pSer/pThr/pTyr-binding forkhead associated (FHA) protein
LLVDGELTIGRNEADLANLGNDPEISRQHARLRRLESGEILIEDLGSTNGTFVNGARIDAPRVLGAGDTIKMGQTTLQLEGGPQRTILSTPAEAPHRPTVASTAAPPAAGAAAPAGESHGIRWGLIGGVALVALGVTAAVIGLIKEGGNGKSGSTQAAAADTSASGAAPSSGSGKAGAGKLTPVGSKLKLGQTAVIAYEDASTHAKSVVAITPSPIQRGSISDFKNIQLTAEQKTATPFYVKVKAKNVGKGDLSGGSPATYIDGIDDRGQRQRSVIFFGEFSRCPSKTPKKLPPGSSYSTCLTYLVPGGGSIVGMRWVVFDRKTGKSDLNWR